MRCTIGAFTLSLATFVLAACTHGDSPTSHAEPLSLIDPAASASTPSTYRLLPTDADIGMWVWHREEVFVPEARARLLSFCQKYGITRLLVQVRFERDDDRPTLLQPEAWDALLRAASHAGIAVEALDGADTMGFAENRATTLARLGAVLDFHRRQPASARFAGIHYDIEPYTSARWKSGDITSAAQEVLETFKLIREACRAADPALLVSHDIPAFYDGQEKFVVEFEGVRKNLHAHIQDLSDYVGIMSYRTRATGPNSAAHISAAELAYGTEIGRPVYLSLETVPLKETPQITFHGRTSEEYVSTLRELHAHLADTPSYGGLLLHQYRTVRDLLENEPVRR